MEIANSDGTGITMVPGGGLYPDWQPLPFKNASEKGKAFPGTYRNHGQCVKAAHWPYRE
jgi:hypothetical protein